MNTRFSSGLLALQAIRWRAASSALLFLVAGGGALAAAFGPMYSLAANESTVRSAVTNASVDDRGLTLTAQLPVRSGTTVPPGDRARQAAGMAAHDLGAWFQTGVLTESVSVRLPPTKTETEGFEADLVARDSVCGHIQLVSGACVAGQDGALVSDRSAARLGATVGSSLPYLYSGRAGAPLKVVGIYRVISPAEDYWFGRNFLTYAPPPPSLGGSSLFQLDAIFVAQAAIDQLGFFAFPLVTEELQLRVDRIGATNIASVQAAIGNFARTALEQLTVTTSSRLPSIIGNLEDQEAQMGDIVALCVAQIVLIDLILLYGVVATAARTREHEVALAKLRGHGMAGVLRVGLLEPVVLIVVGGPVGLGVAWFAVAATSARLLTPRTPVVVNPTTVGAVLLAVGAGVLAAAFAGRQLLIRPLHEQLRVANVRLASQNAVPAVDAVVVALAVAGLVELAISGVLRAGQPDPVAVAAPGLLTLAVALLGMHAMRLVAVALTRLRGLQTANATYLIARRLVRLPSSARQVLVPALAVGLATFGLSTYFVADHNRQLLAGFEVGADRVLTVQPAPGTDLLGIVRSADPGGHEAMAVVQYTWPGGSVLAVDSPRFPYVADWIPGVSDRDPTGIAHWLATTTDPSKLTAVSTPSNVVFNGNGDAAAVDAEGLDGIPVTLDARVQASALPRVASNGVMVDLTALELRQKGLGQTIQDEVWLSAAAGPDIVRGLTSRGIVIESVQTASSVKSLLDSQGLPLAFEFMLVSVIGAAAIAVAAAAFALSADASLRSFEVAVLRVSGWTDAALFRSMLGELVLVSLAACLLGGAAGVAGAMLSLPSVPESVDPAWAVPLQYSLPWSSIGTVLGLFAVLLLGSAAIGTLIVLRFGSSGRLQRGLA